MTVISVGRLGRHPLAVVLEYDPAAVEDHEAVGARLVEEIVDASREAVGSLLCPAHRRLRPLA